MTTERFRKRPKSSSPPGVSALFFDLDGTLVDSLPDITRAINAALAEEGVPPMSQAEVRERLGHGAASILAPALGEADADAPRVARAARNFVSYYQSHLVEHTRPRPGVAEVLDYFSAVPKFVVSNKPEPLPQQVLEALGLAHHFRSIHGGGSFPQKKPDPMPLLHLLARHGLDASRTVMIGDAPVDVQAAKAAGVISCAVMGGLSPLTSLRAASPDYLIPEMSSLMSLFRPEPEFSP